MTKDKENNASIFRKMRLPVIVKPFVLNNQSMCSSTPIMEFELFKVFVYIQNNY